MPSWVYRNGKLVEKTGDVSRGTSGLQIIQDIQPYQSMVTGERIRSRSHHRQHLRDHGVIEVGNEKMEAAPRPTAIHSEARRKALHERMSNMTDRQANQILAQLKDQVRNR